MSEQQRTTQAEIEKMRQIAAQLDAMTKRVERLIAWVDESTERMIAESQAYLVETQKRQVQP